MDEPSSLLKAGKILVLVGAIMSVVSALILALTAVGLGFLGSMAGGEDAAVGLVVSVVYGILSVVLVVGAVFGFLSFQNVGKGEVHTAWIQGLVCALCPPLQVLPLIGSILILVSPEHEAWKRA